MEKNINNIIVEFFEQQRKDIKASKRKEHIQMNVNPDSYIGKEILYQTALLQSLKEDIAEVRMFIKSEKQQG